MKTEPVVTPLPNSSIAILVDWLELIAFFNRFGIARVDALKAALIQQKDEPEENIGDNDRSQERLVEQIEEEIDLRQKYTGEHYPFSLSDDAEELRLSPDWAQERHCFYLTCLLASHVSKNSLIDTKIDDSLVARLRNRVFQVVSTLAMAGLAGGGAGSIGWPRESKETVLEALQRAETRGAGFRTKKRPGEYTPPAEKDGGIDVISWMHSDRPPPPAFWYGQVASGHNWRGKPARSHVQMFESNYFDYAPIRDNTNFATLIPFRLTDENDWISQNSQHGTVLDRTRIPKCGNDGIEQSRLGREMDEIEQIEIISGWVSDFRQSLVT